MWRSIRFKGTSLKAGTTDSVSLCGGLTAEGSGRLAPLMNAIVCSHFLIPLCALEKAAVYKVEVDKALFPVVLQKQNTTTVCGI